MYVYVCIYKHLDNMCVILMFLSAYEYCLRSSFGAHKPNQVYAPFAVWIIQYKTILIGLNAIN